jgi:hypothetical protein
MTAPDEYCDLCDLPKSQCIHGMPPPALVPTPKKAAPRPRAEKRVTTRSSAAPEKVVTRRWTPPEELKPLILSVLQEAGGELDADELFLELELRLEDRFRAGDQETTPEGEPRWRYAARRARIALIDEGLMTKTRPGSWQLA